MRGYLLDTKAISEVVRPRPNAGLLRWLASTDEDTLFLSVVTLGEIRKGVEQLADGPRKTRLAAWLSNDLPDRFVGRLLPVDANVALVWGRIVGDAARRGRTLDVTDALIAATAETYELAVATRNERHFAHTGVAVINPWT